MIRNFVKTPIETIIISVEFDADYLEKLTKRINELMKSNEITVVDGLTPTYWEPVGSPFISDDLISQMMVLYKNLAV